MEKENSFFQRVYKVVEKIPYGRITNYGAIARYLGSARSARMVGWALNQTKFQVPVFPAHRVVNRQGLLSGKKHFGGHDTMAQLLLSEGVQVVENKIVDFADRYWDPIKELPPISVWLDNEK